MTFKRLLSGAFILAAIALVSVIPYSLPSSAWNGGVPYNAKYVYPAGNVLTADDTDVAILVRYVGDGSGATTSLSGLVAVAAGGDLTFTSGTLSSEAAETDFECPSSGANGGVIDVSDTACDTLGEVVDVINCAGTGGVGASTCKWRAVIIDGLRSDISNDSLLTISATQASAENGLELKWDTDTAGFFSTVQVGPREARRMPFYLEGMSPTRRFYMKANPWAGSQANIVYANATSTFGSGTSIWSTRTCGIKLSTNSSFTGSEDCTVLTSIAGGATTANKVFWDGTNPYGVFGNPNEKLIARLTNSAAMATTTHVVNGFWWRYND